MNGVLHVHSRHSDGEFTLAELRHEYTRLGYAFACVTDHAEYFDAEKVATYTAECAALSDSSFRFIPGLEYECPNRIHILGLGCTRLIETRDPQEVIHEIESAAGISVIAHPRTQDFAAIEALEVPATGIEAWNSKYDGRYAPRAETFAMVLRIRAQHPRVRAFYGQDLHFRNQYRGLHVRLAAAQDSEQGILAALRTGEFCAVRDDLTLPADGVIPDTLAQRFRRVHRRSTALRGLMKSSKALLEKSGMGVPAALKSQLRRVL